MTQKELLISSKNEPYLLPKVKTAKLLPNSPKTYHFTRETLKTLPRYPVIYRPILFSGNENKLPNANIVFDRFHVMKIINQAIDHIRKTKVKTNPILTKSKYNFLKNYDNLTGNQKQKLEQIKSPAST
jgi:hypothetical protein